MNCIFKLVVPCRVVRQVHQTIFSRHLKPISLRVTYINSTMMAQRSITSFFKVSPPKPVVTQEKNEEEDKVNGDDTVDSPVTNGKSKASSKRPRLESSESDYSPKKKEMSPPVGSDKKKKVKRQRIESSGSESEASPTSPTPDTQASPTSEEKTVVKVEKTASPKTYASPKSKKKKPLTEVNGVKSPSPKIVKKETSVEDEKKKTLKKEVKKQENESKNTKQDNDIKSESKTTKQDNEIKSESKTAKQDKEIKDEDRGTVTEAEYNPAKSNYHPINDACWVAGAAVPYAALARTLELIEATSARLKIVDILSNYLRSVIVLSPDDLLPSVYLCLNQLAPAYHSLELGIAETYLMKAIGQCTGRTVAQVKAAAAKCGDLGAVAQQARAQQRTMRPPPRLTLRNVFAALKDIAHMKGHASVNKKINKIQSLYVACRYSEAKYLIRSLEGKLRIGLAEQSVLQALALATARTPPAPPGAAPPPPGAAPPSPGAAPPAPARVLDAAAGMPSEQFKALVDEHALIIKTTYCSCPSYERLLGALLRRGVAALPHCCRLAPGVPLKPMLAHPTKRVTHVFDRFENEQFTCEWKYDGERAQIHVPRVGRPDLPGADRLDLPEADWPDLPGADRPDLPGADRPDLPGADRPDLPGADRPDLSRAAVFSRNQENNTSKYPDILRRLPSLLKDTVTSCVLDCEAVAYDIENKQILPFQILSTRKRKDATEADIKVQVCVFVFDLLYLNGESLVRRPLLERRALLREHFNEKQGEWQFATSKDCSTVEEVEQFMEEAVRGSCEGLMVKALSGDHARYDIARRSHNWLKLKKDYLEGVGDSIDAVVIGAYWGRGKRAGLYGGFLLACYDPDTDEYQSLCKIGTGFSDDQLRSLTASLSKHAIDAPKTYYRYSGALGADVWLAAARVWELRCADLSLSPAHRAAVGLLHGDKGISLRFPRFVRERDDKSPSEATTAQQIASLYLAQDQVKNTSSTNSANMDDFY